MCDLQQLFRHAWGFLVKKQNKTLNRLIIISKATAALTTGTEYKNNDGTERFLVGGKHVARRAATSIYFLIPKTGEALGLRKEPFWGNEKTNTRC